MISAALKNVKIMTWWIFYTLILVTATEALGAETSVNWRPTYDMVMRWINFGILIILFFKYARKPLADFLNGKSRQIKENIKKVEEEKEDVKARIDELVNQREKGQKHLRRIRDRVVSQGELKKQKIIDDAKNESHLLLEGAKRKIEHEIISAREKLQTEIVDQAIDLAMQELPQLMTDQDTQKSLKMYLDGIHSLSKS